MNKSLAPFVVVYDKTGRAVAGNGYLNDRLPEAPSGILKAANKSAYHAVTWQPQGDLRFAAVTVASKDYYVLSGRSLKEVEANEQQSLELAFLGGVASAVVVTGAYLVKLRTSSKARK